MRPKFRPHIFLFAIKKFGFIPKSSFFRTIFIHRLSTRNINVVTWASGKESNSASPVVISFPNRRIRAVGPVEALEPLDFKYGSKTKLQPWWPQFSFKDDPCAT